MSTRCPAGWSMSTRRRDVVRGGAEAIVALAEVPVYARVDVVESAVGPAVIEVELNEPALGLHLDPDAPARFADVVLDAVSTVAS